VNGEKVNGLRGVGEVRGVECNRREQASFNTLVRQSKNKGGRACEVRELAWGEKWEQVLYYVAAAFAETHKLNRTHARASTEKHNTPKF
jgi:hypothetical protein